MANWDADFLPEATDPVCSRRRAVVDPEGEEAGWSGNPSQPANVRDLARFAASRQLARAYLKPKRTAKRRSAVR
jgi:hypothetical protein